MRRFIICLSIALTIGICSCNNGGELIALSDCPQEMEGIEVELSKTDDVQTIKITKDGKFLQKLEGDFYAGSAVFDKSIVYYVDANYDGKIDLFIGSGRDRTNNTLLLWNSDKNKFERYSELGWPVFMNPLFSPSENAIYESGSCSAFDAKYTKRVWDNGELKETEYLIEIYDVDVFDFEEHNRDSEHKVSKKYTLLDSNNTILDEVDSVDKLPNNWIAVVLKPNSRWGAPNESESEDNEIIEESEQEVQDDLEESIKKQIVDLINENNGWEVLSGPSSVWNLQKVSEGMYKAEFMTETEYEKMDYEIRNIEVDENGKVLGLETKRVNIRPKANKPDGTMNVDEIIDRQLGRIRNR